MGSFPEMYIELIVTNNRNRLPHLPSSTPPKGGEAAYYG